MVKLVRCFYNFFCGTGAERINLPLSAVSAPRATFRLAMNVQLALLLMFILVMWCRKSISSPSLL